MAVCITMYNEDEEELITTLDGLTHNYIEMRKNETIEFEKDDFLVFIICDGFDEIPESFKKHAASKGFYDESKLAPFMKKDMITGKMEMKDMREIMSTGVKDIP